MIVLSRDGNWLSRLEKLAQRGGWPFEARAAVPSAERTPPPERALALLDRGLAGADPAKTVASLRLLYPSAAIVLVVDSDALDHAGAAAAVSCGVDDVFGKSWPDEKLAPRLAALRDRALSTQSRLSVDGELKVERRSHRAYIKHRGCWKEVVLDSGGFALLWRLLEREGEPVSRVELGAVLAAVAGREFETGTVSRRLAALAKVLADWRGRIENARGGLYRLVSAPR